MSGTTQPVVGKPGAGLPPFERRLAQLALAVYSRTATRAAATRRFQGEAERLVQLASQLQESAARTRVLIRRVMGIEDNSRYWSASMVLEHLVIVDRGIAGIIEHICAGEEYPDEVLISQVKPHPDVGPEITPAFRASVDEFCQRIERIADLHSTAKHTHPWFGALDGWEWYCLGAAHHTIHRRHMQRIVQAFASGQKHVD